MHRRYVKPGNWLPLSLLGVLLAGAAQAGEFDHSHARWNGLLAKIVKQGEVDYARVKRDRSQLDAYLEELHQVTPQQLAGWSRAQRYAFWINVYNAHVVDLIASNYPLGSINDLSKRKPYAPKVWDAQVIPMAAHHPGQKGKLSLNVVENEILRPVYKDARDHAAINCAAASCPPLIGEAFVASKLEQQLDRAIRAFVADRSRNAYDPNKKTARLSKIFEWFRDDFVRDAGSVKAYLKKYGPRSLSGWIDQARISHQEYSWKLNAAK